MGLSSISELAWGEICHSVTRKGVYEMKFRAQKPTRDMVAYKGNHMGLYRMKLPLQNPTRDTVCDGVG